MAAGRKLELDIDGRTFEVQVEQLSADRATVLVDGRPVEVTIRAEQAPAPSASAAPAAPGPTPPAVASGPQLRTAASAPPAAVDGVRAVMPGIVVRLDVAQGQQVASGQVLLVLEAMKMENEIRADREATIAQVHVAVGQKVQTGEVMISYS